MIKNILYCLSALLLLAGCTQGDDDLPTCDQQVQVTISLRTADATRSASGLKPEVENLIYNVAVFQFNAEGIIIGQDYQDVRDWGFGVMEATPTFTLTAATGCTLCLVANISQEDYQRGTAFWGDNLTSYRRVRFPMGPMVTGAEQDGDESGSTRVPQMMMNGYWSGDVTASQQLNVTLGRMMTKMAVVLTNQTGAALSGIKVKLTNVAAEAYVFPQVNADALPASAYLDDALEDDIASLANNASVTRYFYSAPNFCADAARATTLTVTTGSGSKSGTLTLGSTAPASGDAQDYSLYPNSIYTFNVTLK